MEVQFKQSYLQFKLKNEDVEAEISINVDGDNGEGPNSFAKALIFGLKNNKNPKSVDFFESTIKPSLNKAIEVANLNGIEVTIEEFTVDIVPIIF